MTLLQPAVSSSAFLKMGLLGFQGGGKSLTGAKTLIGLYKHTQELGINDGKKPVAMFDTEKGSDWLIPIFKAANVPFVVAKRKSFADLIAVMDDAEANAFALFIDSITHPWRELVESYLRKKERTYLAMDDWGYLKGEHGWQKFTDRYVNSKLHIIMAGRAGYEYENYVEDGRKKMEKVGTKMKTEGETGFEPDLLVLMEQVEDMHTNKVVHRATVQKDRSTRLDGEQFNNPDFKDFLPHINCLALGSAHVGVGESRDSQHMLKIERRDWQPVQRKIVHDEITTLLTLSYPGQTAADKTARLKALIKHFDASWTEIEEVMPLDRLRQGYDTLHRELVGQPSKYAEYVATLAKDANADMNDELPGHSAAPALAPNGEHKPAKDVLLADLANNATIADCVAWGMTVANMKHLSADDHIELGKALMKRQNEIGKDVKKDGDDEGGAGKPPQDGQPEQTPPPSAKPTEPPQPQAEKPARRKASAEPENILAAG